MERQEQEKIAAGYFFGHVAHPWATAIEMKLFFSTVRFGCRAAAGNGAIKIKNSSCR